VTPRFAARCAKPSACRRACTAAAAQQGTGTGSAWPPWWRFRTCHAPCPALADIHDVMTSMAAHSKPLPGGLSPSDPALAEVNRLVRGTPGTGTGNGNGFLALARPPGGPILSCRLASRPPQPACCHCPPRTLVASAAPQVPTRAPRTPLSWAPGQMPHALNDQAPACLSARTAHAILGAAVETPHQPHTTARRPPRSSPPSSPPAWPTRRGARCCACPWAGCWMCC